jgi:FMN phosphatase YigB (HAD superfamily)
MQQNAILIKQNQLIKEELNQLKAMHSHNQKETTVYKKIVLTNSSDSEVLEMQHQRIF